MRKTLTNEKIVVPALAIDEATMLLPKRCIRGDVGGHALPNSIYKQEGAKNRSRQRNNLIEVDSDTPAPGGFSLLAQ